MDKEMRLRVSYVVPQTEYFVCEPCRMVAASPGGGHDPVQPDPGGDITDGKCFEQYLWESQDFGTSHSDVWGD